MATPLYRACPGCGERLPATDAQPDARYDARYNASAECWQLYGEMTVYTLARGYREFIYQLAVDAYGAQHVGETTRPIGVAFALIGLYFACERGHSGRQVQHMHMLLARRAKTWPRFAPPSHVGNVTVHDVMRARPGEERDAMLRRWAGAVWEAWGQEHERVKALVEHVMGD
jgi:hypothetical protein